MVSIYFLVQKLRKVGLHGEHSFDDEVNLVGMQIKVLPALHDNYMYLIIDNSTREAAAIDPVDANIMYDMALKSHVYLRTILTTHHHWDHDGGNEKLVKMVHHKVAVYGGDKRIRGLTHRVKHNEIIKLGDLTVRCILTPGHTKKDVSYHVTSPIEYDGVVFTGDCLIQAGCGSFPEENAAAMHESLTKLSKLPEDAWIFCGHEQSMENLAFAAHVDPDNVYVRRRVTIAKKRRFRRYPTMPSIICKEITYNPFMRVDEPVVQQHVSEEDPIATMRALRKERDNFKCVIVLN